VVMSGSSVTRYAVWKTLTYPKRILIKLIFCGVIILTFSLLYTGMSYGEACITQSQMKPVDRDGIASAARSLSAKIQTNNAAGLRQESVSELTKDYTAMTSLVASTSTKISSTSLTVEQVYLLDATNLKTLADGTNQDAQFFCPLNKSMAEATFLIPALPPGRYAFSQVIAQGKDQSARWGLSYLLREDASGTWAMAGFYPKPLTAAGKDGLWYWTQGREQAKAKHLWTSYLFYQEAQLLLQPASFVSSTHFEQLRKEASSSTPPSLSQGVSADMPLVIKSQSGAEFRLTSLTTDDSIVGSKLYVVAHLAVEPAPDSAAGPSQGTRRSDKPPATLSAKDRNSSAMSALIATYPELKASFGGVWIFADVEGKGPFVTEQAMADIR
jgi:hypothetical protein